MIEVSTPRQKYECIKHTVKYHGTKILRKDVLSVFGETVSVGKERMGNNVPQ